MKINKLAVIGAGFSGAVLARELAERLGWSSDVFDERDHIGGNCHTERDAVSGVMVHVYGPHIFNTNDERVWKYVNRHGDFRPFVNRVKASTARGVFSMPINLHTINQFFGRAFSPAEAAEFIGTLGDRSIEDPENFEEQALKMLGRDLYETFFHGYTKKQWGCDPKELPAAVLKRLPVRFNYNDNYYDKKHQGIPEKGYSGVMGNILDHPKISVFLKTKVGPNDPRLKLYKHVVWTGPLDAYFAHAEGRLGYRTVTFERLDAEGDYQGNAVINYPDMSVPYTRIHEHKHFAPWEKHEKTVAFREYSKETEAEDIPYYPKRLEADKKLLERYEHMARQTKGVTFLGRLATYRYMDMEAVIREALEMADAFCAASEVGQAPPVFPEIKPIP